MANRAQVWLNNDGPKAAGTADAANIDQGSGGNGRGGVGRRSDEDAAGGIVNKDCRVSGSIVRIEVCDDAAQMNGIGSLSFLVAEAVGLVRSGQGGQLLGCQGLGCGEAGEGQERKPHCSGTIRLPGAAGPDARRHSELGGNRALRPGAGGALRAHRAN